MSKGKDGVARVKIELHAPAIQGSRQASPARFEPDGHGSAHARILLKKSLDDQLDRRNGGIGVIAWSLGRKCCIQPRRRAFGILESSLKAQDAARKMAIVEIGFVIFPNISD
jgi:hypothetical protein